MAKPIKHSENVLPPAVRTTSGIQDALFDELDRLRNGTSNATVANAVARVCSGVTEVLALEVEVAKIRMKQPGDGPKQLLIEPLKLGGKRNESGFAAR